MNNVSVLKVNQRFYNLSNNKFCLAFIKKFLSAKSLKQITAWAVLEHSIDILFIVKIAVEAHYIWMI